MKKILILLAVLLTIGAINAGTTWIIKNNPPKTYGYEMSLEAFNASCVKEATTDTTIEKSVATEYCTCVYNKGIDQYGSKEWTNQLMKLSEDSDYTPEMNDFVNQCIVETIN